MSEWAVVAIVLGGILLLAGLVVGLWWHRLGRLTRRVGSFGCGLWTLLPAPDGSPREIANYGLGLRTAGIAHYGVNELQWWRAFSLAPRPARSLDRRKLEMLDRQPLGDPSRPDLVLAHCRHGEDTFDLTMTSGAMAGFVSWLEAAPPLPRNKVV